MSALFLLIALLPSPVLEGGTWLPTAGPAGQRAVLAIAAGGDGATYAAGRGFVYRMAPGQAWVAVGWYVPQVAWDEDQGFDATGPFPASFLQSFEDSLTQSMEARLGGEVDQATASEELVLDLIEDAAQEAYPAPESPYAVSRMATSPNGVWLGTGGGLFRASASGVVGPIADLRPILDLSATDREVVVATPDGLFRVVDGKAERWRQFAASSLARVDGRAAFVAEGNAWWDDGQVGPRPLPTPTGQARLVASGGDVLWVATELAIYRREGDKYTLCPRISERPHRLVSAGDVVIAVADQVIYATDSTCSKWTRHEAPWLGGLSFTDATVTPSGVWAATTEGAFFLGPLDPDLAAATEVEGLRRRLAEVPDLDTLFKAALVEHVLDPASTGYGNRPVWRMLLPEVAVSAQSHAGRREDEVSIFGAPFVPSKIEVLPPRAEWQIVASWRINFDFLTLLLDADGAEGALPSEDLSDDLVDGFAPDPDPEVVLEQEALVSIDVPSEINTEETSPDEAAVSLLVAERSQVRRDRGALLNDVKRLYKERIRLLYQMYTARAAQVGPAELLRQAELDARLDAYTGGAWSKGAHLKPPGVH